MGIISLVHLVQSLFIPKRLHWEGMLALRLSLFSGISTTKYNDGYRGHKKYFHKILPSADTGLCQSLGQALGTDLSISIPPPVVALVLQYYNLIKILKVRLEL